MNNRKNDSKTYLLRDITNMMNKNNFIPIVQKMRTNFRFLMK